jgi:hypothetical protein
MKLPKFQQVGTFLNANIKCNMNKSLARPEQQDGS